MIKKGDFVELDYTGRLKDDKIVFDTTVEEIAKSTPNYDPKHKYAPTIICVGESHLLPGLDDALIGKNPSKFTVEISAEKGFGKKQAGLLKLLPLKLFAKENIQPYAGLDVNVDGQLGIVKTVSGGRVIVDFNHPLSGRDLVYDVDIKGIITDSLAQTRALLNLFNIKFENIDIIDEKASIMLKSKLPEEITTELADNIKKLVKLKSVEISEAKVAEKASKKEIKEIPAESKEESKEA